MTLRRRIAERVRYAAGFQDYAAFVEASKLRCDLPELALTYVVRSKAEADKIIRSFGPAARPLWRNGIYMAELDPFKLELAGGVVEPLAPGIILDIHFAPAITEQAA
jgi:hypothetical protein